ncbi:NUDIX domain-containing protein [Listeria sp. PSOL-1]|uniref:NUDIX domain-containing protein n=1 Tax=Listeria sp. PSOL-1 TaxID=1844999 RepID=UPI0013D26265|nr:NUDIX domain-containing protein [Listeria sp. PSOL-1]
MKPVIPAVKAVIIQDGKFLALKRTQPENGKMDLPGSQMKYGETHAECLYRSVKVDTMLEVQPFILYDTWEIFLPEFQLTGVFYLVEMPKEKVITLSDEYIEYQFLPLEKEVLASIEPVFAERMARWDFEAIRGFMNR